MEKTNVVKNNRGITLIALVVTIIVLIILAGVSINLLFNEYGIVTRAQNAKEMQEGAQLNEQIALNEVAKEMDKILGKTPTEKPTGILTIKELRDSGEYVSKKTTAKDSNDNLIEIPKGFKVATDSGINVTEGIVIEDKDIKEGIGNNRGNQYVWIPVGENIKKADGTEVDITLGRYIFADGTNHKDAEENTLAEGTPILKQNIEDYEDETAIYSTEIDPTSTTIEHEFKELKINREGIASFGKDGLNATALSISNFKTSVENNKGYYIARYEASYGEDGKANSKKSNNFNKNTTVPTQEGYLWNNITQLDAVVASRNLYEQTVATTDLINSYAWDTAIVYIQKFSNDTDYSRQNGYSINSELTNTGENGDEVCKINDMASNMMEWTTEYSNYTGSFFAQPCTFRGGSYNGIYYTSYRTVNGATDKRNDSTFRTALYM